MLVVKAIKHHSGAVSSRHCSLARLIKGCESSQKKKQNLYKVLLSNLNISLTNYQLFAVLMKLHLHEIMLRWTSQNTVLTSCCSEASEVSLVQGESGFATSWGFFFFFSFQLAQSYQHNRGIPLHISPSASHVLNSCCYSALPQLI